MKRQKEGYWEEEVEGFGGRQRRWFCDGRMPKEEGTDGTW